MVIYIFFPKYTTYQEKEFNQSRFRCVITKKFFDTKSLKTS
jgi:hypothetical protein